VASRNLSRFLGDTWGTRIVRLLFTIGAVLTVVSLAAIPGAMGQAAAAEKLLSDGERATATSAEGRAEVRETRREGQDRRSLMDPEVRATVALPDGSQQLALHDPQGAPATAYQQQWAPAPAPYEGSFEVVYDATDPAGTVTAVTDAAERAAYTPTGNVVIAVFFLVWTLAFTYPFVRGFRRAEAAQA
jgi:hypothetical protein